MVVNDEETREKVAFLQNAAGAVPSPFDSWLDIRGLKTLDLRVKRHSANALKVAEWLESQPSDVIERVWYPGLESHPGHEIAARQMHGGFGGIVSVQLAAGAEAAKHFVDHTQIFTLAESLGGVESLIEVPAAMTHASVAGTTPAGARQPGAHFGRYRERRRPYRRSQAGVGSYLTVLTVLVAPY